MPPPLAWETATMSDAMRQVAILRAACCVAGADGHTSDAEQRVVKRLADEAGVGDASLEAMIERFPKDLEFEAVPSSVFSW